MKSYEVGDDVIINVLCETHAESDITLKMLKLNGKKGKVIGIESRSGLQTWYKVQMYDFHKDNINWYYLAKWLIPAREDRQYKIKQMIKTA